MKTKQEILDNKFKERGIRKGWIGDSKQAVLDVMDEYAGEKLHISDVITSCGRGRTKISCIKCGEEFETWIKIDTGDYDEIFCSDKCGIEYYGGTYVETEFN